MIQKVYKMKMKFEKWFKTAPTEEDWKGLTRRNTAPAEEDWKGLMCPKA